MNLLRLPDYIESKAVQALTNLSKEYDYSLFRFPNMIQQIKDIYNNENKDLSFKGKKKKKIHKESLF